MENNSQTVKNPYELNEPPKPEWLDDAITKWLTKLDFVVLETKLREKKDKMDLNYTVKENERDFALENIRKVLDKMGILTEFRAEYIAFGLELFKVWQKYRPNKWKWRVDWERELKIIAQKWKLRGLKTEVMLEIAKLFNATEIANYF